MFDRMYILTAADGFTTCCDATQKAADIEVSRLPLLSPIRIDHWMVKGADWFRVFTLDYRPPT